MYQSLPDYPLYHGGWWRLLEVKRGSLQIQNRGKSGKIRAGRDDKVAEGVGFEPTIPGGIPVFKTGAIVHSAIPPQLKPAPETGDIHYLRFLAQEP